MPSLVTVQSGQVRIHSCPSEDFPQGQLDFFWRLDFFCELTLLMSIGSVSCSDDTGLDPLAGLWLNLSIGLSDRALGAEDLCSMEGLAKGLVTLGLRLERFDSGSELRPCNLLEAMRF